MKRMTCVLMVAVLLVAVASAWADEKPAKEKPGQAGAAPLPRVRAEGNEGALGRSSAAWYIDSLDKTVQLTDEQKKTITSILDARDKATKDFNATNAEKLKAATEAITKAQKEYQELYAPLQELMTKSQAELDKVLTAEQKTKQREAQTLTMLKSLTAPVELSDEQVKKFRAAYDKSGAGEVFGGNWYESLDEILTAEQKVAITKHRLVNYAKMVYTQAKLTDEQSKQIATICDELAKNASLKMSESYRSYKSLTDKVTSLLTDEQKEAMKKVQTAWGQGGGIGVQRPGVPQITPAPGANPNPAVKKPDEKK